MENRYTHRAGEEPDGSVLLRYIRSEASDTEKVWVEGWLNDNEENGKTLEQIARIYYAGRTRERISLRNSQTAYNKVCEQMKRNVHTHWLSRFYVAAACFVGVLIVSSVLSYLGLQEYRTGESQMVTVQANAGMRTHITLPDGTIAYLNSGSLLSYPLHYEKKERKVTLSGEAYFKVTHNPEQPFVVSVSDDKMRVRVLGTEFNLQAYEDDNTIRTTLVTGLVNLEIKDKSGRFRKQQLKPSERATYDWGAEKVKIEKVKTIYETAWKEGKLMFNDCPLPEFLKKCSYFYNVRFDVKDPVIQNYCFTGTFENKQLFQVLDYLKISSNIDYEIIYADEDDSNGVKYTTVLLWKKKK